MTIHPLVKQLQFARSELQRCIEGISETDATRRFLPMNCISWIVGHLANQEARYWVLFAQSDESFVALNDLVGYGKPASTPALSEMLATWQAVIRRADEGLAVMDAQKLLVAPQYRGRQLPETFGTLLQRNIYHYWFHTGEAYAIRQMLGHTGLPDFVGSMESYPYLPEDAA